MRIIANSHRVECPVLLTLTLCLSIWIVSVAYGSELITHELDSKEVAGNMVNISSVRKFQVYLPDEYHKREDKRYPVLYWLPGWGSGTVGVSYRKALDDAIADRTIPATIAVFIDIHEGITLLSSPVYGNWEAFMISELVPFIDREYRTIPDPRARALMGHSAGGYSALMLPILRPGVWGSVGGNDPALWIMWYFTSDWNTALQGVNNLPDDLKGRTSWRTMTDIMMQMGAAFTPNPDTPLLCDFPITPEGKWNTEVQKKWNEYSLMTSQTLTEHTETLNDLLCIAIVVPELSDGTCRTPNLQLMGVLEQQGIEVTRLDMPGGHSYYDDKRFVAIAKSIMEAMVGAEVSVPLQESMTVTWGAIKQ